MIIEGDGNIGEVITYLEYHKCDNKDWEKFYPPSKKTLARFEKMKNEGYMNCLTGFDTDGNEIDFDLYGENETTPHRRLEFFYGPCEPK